VVNPGRSPSPADHPPDGGEDNPAGWGRRCARSRSWPDPSSDGTTGDGSFGLVRPRSGRSAAREWSWPGAASPR
jgi:hypothetical protein